MRLPADQLSALARVYEGVVTTGRLTALGADPAWIHRQVAVGHWRRLHRGVLYVYSGQVPWRARALAAVQYAGAGAAVSHHVAGHLLGLTAHVPLVIDVSVPAPRRLRPSAGIRVHVRTVMPPARAGCPSS